MGSFSPESVSARWLLLFIFRGDPVSRAAEHPAELADVVRVHPQDREARRRFGLVNGGDHGHDREPQFLDDGGDIANFSHVARDGQFEARAARAHW